MKMSDFLQGVEILSKYSDALEVEGDQYSMGLIYITNVTRTISREDYALLEQLDFYENTINHSIWYT